MASNRTLPGPLWFPLPTVTRAVPVTSPASPPAHMNRRRLRVIRGAGAGVSRMRLSKPEPSPRVDGAGRPCEGLALAFRQDVRELLIEVEVPVLRAGRHGGVGPLQEGLQGSCRGLEQGLALR